MSAIIQQKLEQITNYRIVLSEKVYSRLLECANLCRLDNGKENKEYGTILYGYLAEDNAIFFEEASQYDDYTPKRYTFDIKTAPKMQDELIQKIFLDKKCNCIAHMHTHPYLESQRGGSRFLSEEDIDYYKTTFNFSNLDIDKKIYSFGGLLTIGDTKQKEQDDISFVHYNPKTKKVYLFPNLSILLEIY